ncbi:MAG: hypothetical protein JNL83_24205 [Myxococcales bacterium]|nr:hypothetical protein [Myxococcales bacterium]
MAVRSLPAVAVAMAALAAVLLPLAIARRCDEPAADAPPPPPRRPAPPAVPDDALVAAMFGASCRHQIACGIGVGKEDRCAFIEDTMRRMPKGFALRPCDRIDVAEAHRCIDDLAKRDCRDFAPSLALPDLQAALDRVPSCRLACALTASSP